MRLNEEFKDITEQLNELYHYKRFLEERISMLEYKLKEAGEMMDFVDSLNGISHGPKHNNGPANFDSWNDTNDF